MLIPIINPKAFTLRKHLNETLKQNSYVAKVIIPDWKKYENELLNECILSECPHEPKSKRMLLLIFPNKTSYLYNPISGVFYLFGSIRFPNSIQSCVLDVQVNKHTIYVRDTYVWDNVFMADLYFSDRKQITDVIMLHLQSENSSWIFLQCKYIFSTKDKKNDKNYFLLYSTFDKILLSLAPSSENATEKRIVDFRLEEV